MNNASKLLISADSHVIEPSDLWKTRLPPSLRDRAPVYKEKTVFQGREGGTNPVARMKEMAMDGVSGEVLYPRQLHRWGAGRRGHLAVLALCGCDLDHPVPADLCLAITGGLSPCITPRFQELNDDH